MSDQLVARFTKRFPGGALIESQLTLPANGFSCAVLFGPSGCGKTTILRCLAGLERPESGVIRFGSETWCDAAQRISLSPQKRRVGFVFQDYALFPHLTVAANVGYSLREMPRPKRRLRVAEILERLGLAGLENRYPNQISGGEQQRASLARSLVHRPRLLLLDEPLAALDSALRDQVRRELRSTLQAFDIPTILVTHERLQALALADQLVLLDAGRVIQTGPAADVFARPVNATAARNLGVDTIVPVQMVDSAILVKLANSGELVGRAQVDEKSDLVRVRAGQVELLAAAPARGAQPGFACVRAEDVEIQPISAAVLSGVNHLTGRIRTITDEGASFRVDLDCGFSLAALVARATLGALGLCPGQLVIAKIEPDAIRLVP